MLKIKDITEKSLWQEFLLKKEIIFYPLFQSWNWGEVQKALGTEIIRLGLYENSKLIGLAMIVDVKARRGHFLHLRHGPVLTKFSDKNFDFLIDAAKKIAYEKKACFIRISPAITKERITNNFFKEKGFISAPIHNMDAELCWVLDIDKPEDQILSQMRKSHRYLIRKAIQMDILITQTTNVDKIDDFMNIYRSLSQRKHFVPHRGIREELGILGRDNEAVLFLAKYKNKIIGGAMIVFVGNMAVYHHGATDALYRDIPASYLMQWEAILEARRRGKKIYNFWGIAPIGRKNHPWAGHTLFKTGFGGHSQELVHAQDLPLNALYWKNYAIEFVRKKIKGY